MQNETPNSSKSAKIVFGSGIPPPVEQPLSSDNLPKTVPSDPDVSNSNSLIRAGDLQELQAKINADYISICVYSSTQNNVHATEYFLEHTEMGLSFPATRRLDANETWKSYVEKFLTKLGARNFELKGIMRLDRWFVPGTTSMNSHAIHSVSIRPEFKGLFSNNITGEWATAADILQLHSQRKLISVELVDTVLRFELPEKPNALGSEISPEDVYLGLELHKARKSGLELIVQAAHFGKNEQDQLYKEYLGTTLPFLLMGIKQFSFFMKQFDWDEEDIVELFRTFDMQNRGGITFRDFLCGLAVLEPGTQHGGPPAEVRCRYIFRYYDKNNDGRLDFTEFRAMVAAIRKAKGLPGDITVAHLEAERSATYVFGESISETLGQTEFLTAVGQLKFRGTSHLLRSPKSVVIYLRHQANDESLKKKPSHYEIETTTSLSLLDETGAVMQTDLQTDLRCYDVATHCVRVKKSGTILDIHSLWDIEHSGLASVSPGNKILIGGGANRIQSVENFNQQSKPNEMLNGLRYFERAIPVPITGKGQFAPKISFDWGEIDRVSLANCLMGLCHQAKRIFTSEPRLIELSSPVYIMGDLHGNFPDLLCFEKALWRLGPILTPASFLFLGDYVDRGIYSVEVVSYLFAQKVSAPSKIFLLRGNHEIREVQQMFTFFNECLTKFGEKLGREVWDAVNEAFDCMPLAATIDKKIFCAHGGIPPPWIGHGMVATINSIPVPLSKPEEQSKLSWELMWSDPIHIEQISPEQLAGMALVEGFGENTRRGTGHIFTSQALDTFLQRNHFSHVIRAHEVAQAGFRLQLDGKLLTVFSSSKYCGGSNEAACILADKYKLRTIRIDTS